MSIEFQIVEANINRKERNTQWIRVKVYVDNIVDDILWMNEIDIEKNKKFGNFRNSLENIKWS